MLYAQLRGNNQGIIKITTGGMNRAPTAQPMALDKETPLSALINGNNQVRGGLGPRGCVSVNVGALMCCVFGNAGC